MESQPNNKSRIIWLGDPDGDSEIERGVDAACAIRVIDGLQRLPGLSPIKLFINCYGGEDDHARAIIDAIKSDKRKIIGTVYGRAESAAAWILQACDYRIMMPRSHMMLHMDSGEGYSAKLSDDIFLNDIHQRMVKVDPTLTKRKLLNLMKKNWYINPMESLKFGLVDKVEKN